MTEKDLFNIGNLVKTGYVTINIMRSIELERQ